MPLRKFTGVIFGITQNPCQVMSDNKLGQKIYNL